MRTSSGPRVANPAVVIWTRLGLSTFHKDGRGTQKPHSSLRDYWHVMLTQGEVAFFSNVVMKKLPFFQ